MRLLLATLAAVLVGLQVTTVVHGQQRVPLPIPVSQAGRFQVVNGTPEITRNIMLLDSVTGEAWIYCDHQGGVPGWCYMPRSSTAASKN